MVKVCLFVTETATAWTWEICTHLLQMRCQSYIKTLRFCFVVVFIKLMQNDAVDASWGESILVWRGYIFECTSKKRRMKNGAIVCEWIVQRKCFLWIVQHLPLQRWNWAAHTLCTRVFFVRIPSMSFLNTRFLLGNLRWLQSFNHQEPSKNANQINRTKC